MKVLVISSRMDRSEKALFAGLRDAGIDIDVVYDPDVPEYERFQCEGFSAEAIVFRSRIDFKAVRLLRKKLKAGNYDVIHSLTNRALSNSIFASMGMDLRHVAYRGTMGHLSRFDPASWLTFLSPALNCTICVSAAVKKYMMTLGISESKLVVIHKGHDVAWYNVPVKPSLEEFNIPNGAFIVGYAGGFRPVKGVDVLIRSALYLPEDVNIHYLLLGEGRLESTLRELAGESKINGKIHFAGFRNDAMSLISACNVFVMPSTAREGLPRGVIEAMALGVPVIVSRVGGMPEIVSDGKNGIIVEPSDPKAIASAIMDLHQDRTKLELMGCTGRSTIQEKFNIKNTIEKTLEVYRAMETLN